MDRCGIQVCLLLCSHFPGITTTEPQAVKVKSSGLLVRRFDIKTFSTVLQGHCFWPQAGICKEIIFTFMWQMLRGKMTSICSILVIILRLRDLPVQSFFNQRCSFPALPEDGARLTAASRVQALDELLQHSYEQTRSRRRDLLTFWHRLDNKEQDFHLLLWSGNAKTNQRLNVSRELY